MQWRTVQLLRCCWCLALHRKHTLFYYAAAAFATSANHGPAATSPCRPATGANWLKLRAFGLTQYDAVVLVDSNAYISGDISPLFNLPTDFAASWDQVGIFRGRVADSLLLGGCAPAKPVGSHLHL